MFTYTDGNGDKFDFRYIVTQHPDEGPEYLEWYASGSWEKFPIGMPVPREVVEHFHGRMAQDAADDFATAIRTAIEQELALEDMLQIFARVLNE